MSSDKKSKKSLANGKKRYYQEKLYPALRNTRDGEVYGYVNEKGKWDIEPKFKSAYDFNGAGSAIVQVEDKYGLINTKGEYIVIPIYDNINQFQEMRAVFVIRGIMGVMNEKGNILTKRKYDFIGDYNEGKAVVGISSDNGDYKYGYIDLDGEEVISPKFISANNFNEGVALVKEKGKPFSLIDANGKVIGTYNYEYVSQYGDGSMVFSELSGGPYGYINSKGEVIIKPIYKEAEGFKDKVAVVSVSENYNGPYGLIDLTGKYIYQPIYSDIKILGEGMNALGMSLGEDKNISRSIYAIADTVGNKLTDFKYLVVGDYSDGITYASDNTSTFFINKLGNVVKNLPKVNGSGELLIKGNIIYANIDYSPYYLDKSGKVIYKPNDVIILDKEYSVKKVKYKPNINYLIYNPEVNGVIDKKVEGEINNKLKEISYFNPYVEEDHPKDIIIKQEDVLDFNYYGNFEVKYFKKDLLILDIMGYYYPIGAAHGMPTKHTPSIDLVTGKFYTLGDLFMGGVYWLGELNKIIKNMIETDKQYSYVFEDSFKSIKSDQDFYIDDSNLYIYFSPYDIGPYSAGFITFKIPFSEMQGMINKSGEFYKSFH
ncbi:MAG: WG repeat-containing protein [Clostridium sp.]